MIPASPLFLIYLIYECYKYVFISDVAPTPTESICKHFNELRSDLALAIDLKNALNSYEFELQALRHQYEALNPGKVKSFI